MTTPTPLAALAVIALATPATLAQKPTFSIDFHGPTNAATPCGAGGPTIHQGDLLEPNTPARDPELAAPSPVCVAARGGAVAGSLGLPAYPAFGELDALSYGQDARIKPTMPAGSYKFSVDEYALGFPFAVGVEPSVQSESGASDVSASCFVDTGIPVVPAPFGTQVRNVEFLDGDGLPSANGFTTPGLGLIEPNPIGFAPDAGDNLDALDADGANNGNLALFSLDAGWFDPLSGAAWTDSAVFNGFLPSQILASNLSGAAPVVWASSIQLGLVPGAPVDDIDALAVWDNGNGSYDPPGALFAWNAAVGPSDMVLFSLRRGSATVGQVDSLLGLLIEESDVLIPPLPGGLNGNPGILIPGEALGLATRRTGTGRVFNGAQFADDLDALDVTSAPVFDCNQNGREDALDIATGGACDANQNGVPDACELVTYCTAGTSASGCQAQIAASGVASASAASGFVLSASNVEGDKQGTFYFGVNGRQANPWGNGTSYQCVVPPVRRGGPLPASGTPGLCDGAFSQDLNALWCPACPNPGKNPGAGTTVAAQLWYRDPLNTSSRTTSLSDAVEFVVCP